MGKLTRLLAVGLCSLLSVTWGCAPTTETEGVSGGNDTTFSFSSFGERSYELRVVDTNGNPLSGVLVSVETVYLRDRDDDDESPAVYASGLTGADGRLLGSLRTPADVTAVDVIVDDEDKDGPWSDEALKNELGFFAPSSRQTLSIGDGALVLTIVLENA